MLIPAPRLLAIICAFLVFAIAAAIWPSLLIIPWLVIAVLVAAIAAGDALIAWRWPAPHARRIVPGSLAVGVAHDVALRIANSRDRAIACDVYDHYPDGVIADGLPRRASVPPKGWTEIRYNLRPVQRGELRFGPIELRIDSALGLWQLRRRLIEETVTRVYPNFAALTRFALLTTDNRLSQIGVLQRRRRGEGLDFHQLREYREGDSQRQVDWKATARMRRVISREYQDERDQQIVLLIDCGRRMAAKDGDIAHFDHVLNAALLLAYVSLRQGDAVGFLSTSGTERWFAPRKSASTVSLILNRVYDLHPTLQTTDYYEAALSVMRRVRKRSLIVILSNLRDEDDEALKPALALLQSRHLVLFASFREAILSQALAAPVRDFDAALTHAASADYLRRRELAFRKMERGGAVCIDVEPQELPIALVNRYIDIKRSGRL